jgi:uncharacterized protein (TIGR02246 family)
MTTTDDQLAQLLDIEAIKQLKARYFRTLDTKDWDGFGLVFTPDAVMEIPEADATVHGRDEIVAGVSTSLVGTQTVHHGHMPEIELTGPDSARGTWAMADYVEWPPSDTGDRVGLRGYGHYVEEYARTADGWQIAHLRLERLRIDPLP